MAGRLRGGDPAGHASIKLTVDNYGRWLPMGNKAAMDRLEPPPKQAPPLPELTLVPFDDP